MKNTSLLTALVLALGLSYSASFAQDKTPVVDKREKLQQDRIREGVKSGQLTPAETRKLEKQEGKIKANEMIAKADGKVTKKERKKLNKELNRESRRIHRLKHNNKKVAG